MSGKTDNAPSVQRIAQLQQMIADFAKVLRVPHLADTGRRENDVEHSYGLAITAWFLAPKIAPELDLHKIFSYALAHDIVEIHAGDTTPFGPKERIATKSKREDEALTLLGRAWPDFPELIDYAKGYKDKRDEEAIFVYALDKILPAIMVNLGEKKSHWTRHKITLQMHSAEKEEKLRLSKYMWPYHQRLIDWATNPDYFYKPTKDEEDSEEE